MANHEHLEILKQGAEVWNQWRKENPYERPDLSRADLSGIRELSLLDVNLYEVDLVGANFGGMGLSGVDFSEAFLNHAELTRCHLFDAKFIRAHLRSTNFSWSYLERANFSEADLSDARLIATQLYQANFRGAKLHRTNLSFASLVHVNFDGADLTGCEVFAASVWDASLEGTIQTGLRIVPSTGGPNIEVDDLEVAQFIYLLVNHRKLRKVINSVTERGVLILGRFAGGGLGLLESIAAKLREADYLPIIFNFDRPESRDFTETVKTLVGLSRFVIADLSGPSVAQELYATVPHYKIPFVPIIEEGRKPYSMIKDILEYPWVVNPPVEFASEEQLMELLPMRVIAAAEEKHKERQKLLNQLFAG